VTINFSMLLSANLAQPSLLSMLWAAQAMFSGIYRFPGQNPGWCCRYKSLLLRPDS